MAEPLAAGSGADEAACGLTGQASLAAVGPGVEALANADGKPACQAAPGMGGPPTERVGDVGTAQVAAASRASDTVNANCSAEDAEAAGEIATGATVAVEVQMPADRSSAMSIEAGSQPGQNGAASSQKCAGESHGMAPTLPSPSSQCS